jgi:hypothetical protein
LRRPGLRSRTDIVYVNQSGNRRVEATAIRQRDLALRAAGPGARHLIGRAAAARREHAKGRKRAAVRTRRAAVQAYAAVVGPGHLPESALAERCLHACEREEQRRGEERNAAAKPAAARGDLLDLWDGLGQPRIRSHRSTTAEQNIASRRRSASAMRSARSRSTILAGSGKRALRAIRIAANSISAAILHDAPARARPAAARRWHAARRHNQSRRAALCSRQRSRKACRCRDNTDRNHDARDAAHDFASLHCRWPIEDENGARGRIYLRMPNDTTACRHSARLPIG